MNFNSFRSFYFVSIYILTVLEEFNYFFCFFDGVFFNFYKFLFLVILITYFIFFLYKFFTDLLLTEYVFLKVTTLISIHFLMHQVSLLTYFCQLLHFILRKLGTFFFLGIFHFLKNKGFDGKILCDYYFEYCYVDSLNYIFLSIQDHLLFVHVLFFFFSFFSLIKFISESYRIILKLIEYISGSENLLRFIKVLIVIYFIFLLISIYLYIFYFGLFSEKELEVLVSNPNYDACWAFKLVTEYINSSITSIYFFFFFLFFFNFLCFVNFIKNYIVKVYNSAEDDEEV